MKNDMHLKVVNSLVNIHGRYLQATSELDLKEEVIGQILTMVTSEQENSKQVARKLRDLEILTTTITGNSQVNIKALQSLTTLLVDVYKHARVEGVRVLKVLFSGNKLTNMLIQVSNYSDKIYTVAKSNEKSIIIPNQLSLQQATQLTEMLSSIERDVTQVLVHTMVSTLNYEKSYKRIKNYRESITFQWLKYSPDLYNKHIEEEKQKVKKLEEENLQLIEENARIEKEIKERTERLNGSRGIQNYNGRNYDMDAINAGYHELATHTDGSPSWLERKLFGKK